MSWINDPELTSEQKTTIYQESMEKAMDSGAKLALSEVPMYQNNLVLRLLDAEETSPEKVEAYKDALGLSLYHFKVQAGEGEEYAWENREERAQELISDLRRVRAQRSGQDTLM